MEDTQESPFATAMRVDILEKISAARLLVLLAGSCALVLGVIMFLLQYNMGPRIGPLGLYGTAPLVMMLLIDLAFGAFLLYAYMGMPSSSDSPASSLTLRMTTRDVEWSTMVLAFALVLVVLGGIAGAVAGILAGVGALSVMVRHWRRPADG